ncbi:MAG: hypothetical protein HRU20_17110 [Pseudomonadales bacterium]|nr:hypothetical protein [Pseudomonadales bacterium]
MSNQADVLLSQVQKSPAAVAIHDKDAWMSIFAQYHIVEDPVGSTPHVGGIYDTTSGERGHAALGRFFDTFIAPNKISFDVKKDIVCGNHVVRDLTINIEMSPTVKASVEMHLLYELVQEGDEWKVVRLAAHWELLPMVMQLLKKGFACAGVLAGLTVRMLRYQGIAGTLGFSKAALNIGNKGKKAVETFVKAFNHQDLSTLMSVCASDAALIHMPFGQPPLSPSQVFEKVNGKMAICKLLASGETITATVSLQQENGVKEGVMIAEFNRKTGKIVAMRLYWD